MVSCISKGVSGCTGYMCAHQNTFTWKGSFCMWHFCDCNQKARVCLKLKSTTEITSRTAKLSQVRTAVLPFIFELIALEKVALGKTKPNKIDDMHPLLTPLILKEINQIKCRGNNYRETLICLQNLVKLKEKVVLAPILKWIETRLKETFLKIPFLPVSVCFSLPESSHWLLLSRVCLSEQWLGTSQLRVVSQVFVLSSAGAA